MAAKHGALEIIFDLLEKCLKDSKDSDLQVSLAVS